jgi:hypothetical protein
MTSPGGIYTVSLTSDPVDENGNRPTYDVDAGEYERLIGLGVVVNAPATPSPVDFFDTEVSTLIGTPGSASRAKVAEVAAGTPPVAHTHTASQISDSSATGRSVLTAATAAAARTAIGAGTASTKADVGLGNVDNTSDVNKPVSSAQTTAINTASTADRARANHTGTQTSSTLSDLTETVQDIVGALIVAGTGVTVSYDDAAGTFTINATGGGTGTTDPEIVRDTIGGALVAGAGIQITVNDAGDTITVASTAVLPTRQVAAGTGLSGGGDLSADRTLAVAYGTTAGTAVQGNDARVVADQAAGTASIRTLGTGAQQAAAGNHGHPAAGITDSTATGRSVLTAGTAASARSAIGAGVVDSADASVLQVVKITQAAYDAIVTKVATTLYVIVG